MTIDSARELFYFVASIALAWVAVLLCWALYEVATLLRRSNQIVDDVQQKISNVERFADHLKETLMNPLSYAGLLAGGGKALWALFKDKQGKKIKDPKGRKKSDLFDD